MKTSLLAILTGALVASAVAAEPADVLAAPFKLTTNFGDSYYNCRVIKVTPETMTIMHELGVTKIGLDLLSPELQKRLNYDPVKAREFARAEQEKKDEELARIRTLKEKRDREERAMMADLMATEKAQLQAQAAQKQAAMDGRQTATAPAQPLAPMPGDPTPMLGSATTPAPAVMQTEVVVPATTPITQVFTPGANQSQRYLYRSNGYYYPWYSGYDSGYSYGYTYPVYGVGYYTRPPAPCPPFVHQPPSRPVVSGTIKVGNGVIKINR